MPRESGDNRFRSMRQSRLGFWFVLCMLPGLCFFIDRAASQEIPSQRDRDARLVAPSPPASPVASSSISLQQALELRGDLSFQDATIAKALFTIGASWRVNIVVGKDVKGTVSCIYKQAPLREVLDAILLANGYSYRAVGESLVVLNSQQVGVANPLFESAAITITHSDLDEVLDGGGCY